MSDGTAARLPPRRMVRRNVGADLSLVGLPPLMASSLRMSAQHAALIAMGPSPHAALFERQMLTAVGDRALLGRPGRPEFSDVGNDDLSVINLAAYSYLGLGADPRIKQAAKSAIEQYGTHTGGPRLLNGTARIHCEFEERLARFSGAPGVVTYSSGYVTNVSVVSTLFGPGDLIVLDRNAHRSLYDGALLSRARIKRFAHSDLDHLESILHRTEAIRRRLVVVDSVYSMGGDIAPLPALVDLVRRCGAFLLVDDAHGFGMLGEHGQGAVEHFGLRSDSIDLRIGTLSKAIPAVGGFVAAHASIIVLLRYTSHARVFSAAMTPPDVAAAMAGIDILEREPERVARLQRNAAFFRAALERQGIDTMGSETAIVPVWVGDQEATLAAASTLLARGIYVNAILPPGVPRGAERLRCLVTAAHAEADLAFAAETIGEVVRPLCRVRPERVGTSG